MFICPLLNMWLLLLAGVLVLTLALIYISRLSVEFVLVCVLLLWLFDGLLFVYLACICEYCFCSLVPLPFALMVLGLFNVLLVLVVLVALVVLLVLLLRLRAFALCCSS